MLFVCSGSSTRVSCLMEDFVVRNEVACPPKDSRASISAPFLALELAAHYVNEDAGAAGAAMPSGVSLVDINGDGRPLK